MLNKPFSIILLIILAGLTVSTSYFYTQTKNKSLNNNKNLNTNVINEKNENANNSNSANDNINTNSSNLNENSNSSIDGEVSPLVSKNRASNPENAYQIKSGETLYPIGLKFNLDWNLIARGNGLTDPNDIKAGQVLVIPDYDADSKKLSINYKIDQVQSDTYQKNLASGKETWRQDPIEVTKKEITPCFGLTSADTYTIGSRNDEKGLVQISVSKNNQSYEIGLTEPSTKGTDGIWTISYIKEI